MSHMTINAIRVAWEQLGWTSRYPSQDELDEAIQTKAQEMDDLIGDLTQRLRDQGIARFRQSNQGHHPPFLETIQIGNRARSQAEEMILYQELGERGDLEGQREDDESIPEQSWRDSPDRWKRYMDEMGDPEPEIDALTDEVWPEKTVTFRVTAAYLMQTRYEDAHPIPQTPDDPLKQSFTDLVESELTRTERVLSEYRKKNPTS